MLGDDDTEDELVGLAVFDSLGEEVCVTDGLSDWLGLNDTDWLGDPVREPDWVLVGLTDADGVTVELAVLD